MKKTHGTTSILCEWLNEVRLEAIVRASDYSSRPILSGIEHPTRLVTNLNNKQWTLFFSEAERREAYDSENYLAEIYGKGYAGFCEHSTIPGEIAFEEAQRDLGSLRETHRTFFKFITVYRHVDEGFFNSIAKKHLGSTLSFRAIEGSFHMKLEFTAATHHTFEQYIELKYIIHPAMDNSNTLYENMRCCPKCQKFFVAATKKTMFCSPSCRVMYQRSS